MRVAETRLGPVSANGPAARAVTTADSRTTIVIVRETDATATWDGEVVVLGATVVPVKTRFALPGTRPVLLVNAVAKRG